MIWSLVRLAVSPVGAVGGEDHGPQGEAAGLEGASVFGDRAVAVSPQGVQHGPLGGKAEQCWQGRVSGCKATSRHAER